MLLGRDVSKIPCFRNTFLYGIGGGLGAGLIAFMLTSRPQLSSHVAVASFTVVSMCFWMQCRYTYSKTKFELAQVKLGMQRHVMYEGTQIQKEIEAGHAKDA